ncbi:hypothetical protein DH2020_038341 [Rehmannia glutinosa]|uniref:4-coumarate--CoA ligase n=1 Tax=Rehmannia glutinosa TaxID=99300 RepID=A0ABR0V062_REHGL
MANPFFTPAEVIKQAKASNAKLIITQSCYVYKVRDYASEKRVKVVLIDTPPPPPVEASPAAEEEIFLHYSVLTGADAGEMPAVKISPDDVVALPYSSGTTGLPKGVMLTHKGLVTSVAQQVDGDNPNLYIHSEDVMLCVLPLFHIYSLNSVLLCGLRVGAAIVIMQKFDIVPFLEVMQKYRVTIGPFVPPIVLAIVKSPVVDKYDLSSVRTVMSGAAPLGKELEDAVRIKFPNAKLGQGYGMTEAGPVLAMCLAFAKEPFEIKSVHADLCLTKKLSYLNDPEATERTIDKEGWLHTGDVGFIDDDDELFIVDRIKEIIKYKGFQVAPAELEALLLNHPYISDAAVVSMKDEQAGEVPVAFVVKSNGSIVTEDEIKQFVSKQVIFYKRINRVFFIDAIPKSPSGKILRKDLRARLAAGALSN